MTNSHEKPFTIRDGHNRRVQSFVDFDSAEAAAISWCREKGTPVPVYQRSTHVATVSRCASGRCVVDLTMQGSLVA